MDTSSAVSRPLNHPSKIRPEDRIKAANALADEAEPYRGPGDIFQNARGETAPWYIRDLLLAEQADRLRLERKAKVLQDRIKEMGIELSALKRKQKSDG